MASFVLSFFPLDVLDEIWDLIESVSEGFLTYSFKAMLWFEIIAKIQAVFILGFRNQLLYTVINEAFLTETVWCGPYMNAIDAPKGDSFGSYIKIFGFKSRHSRITVFHDPKESTDTQKGLLLLHRFRDRMTSLLFKHL